MTNAELTTKLAELESRILYLEQQQQGDSAVLHGFPFGTWKEYPPTQGAPSIEDKYTVPSYHCTYEHP